MKATVQDCIIDMDMVMKPAKQVWSWEIPVLQQKHGVSKVRLQEATEIEVDSLPDANEEFARLARAYGVDGGGSGTNLSYVELAYGRGRAGVTELEKEIGKSPDAPKAKKAKAKKATAKKATAKKAKAEKPETGNDSKTESEDPLDF